MAKRKVTRKKIVKKNIADGIVHIAASFNNTMVTVTDNAGNAIAWSSAGNLGFKGSKKSTPFAAQQAVEDAMTKAMEHGINVITSYSIHYTKLYETKSPNLPSSSLPIGASSETGSLVILITCFTLSTGNPTSFAISSTSGSLPFS